MQQGGIIIEHGMMLIIMTHLRSAEEKEREREGCRKDGRMGVFRMGAAGMGDGLHTTAFSQVSRMLRLKVHSKVWYLRPIHLEIWAMFFISQLLLMV